MKANFDCFRVECQNRSVIKKQSLVKTIKEDMKEKFSNIVNETVCGEKTSIDMLKEELLKKIRKC